MSSGQRAVRWARGRARQPTPRGSAFVVSFLSGNRWVRRIRDGYRGLAKIHVMIPLPRLILASVSPRRAALMREAGYEVEIIPPPLEEPTGPDDHPSPGQLAEALSHFKANSVAGLVVGVQRPAAGDDM